MDSVGTLAFLPVPTAAYSLFHGPRELNSIHDVEEFGYARILKWVAS